MEIEFILKEYNIINLTPHQVVIVLGSKRYEFPSMGFARIIYKTIDSNNIKAKGKAWLPIRQIEAESVMGLLPQRENVLYIVSHRMLLQVPNRQDLIAPDVETSVKQGQSISVTGFVTYYDVFSKEKK